MLRPSILAALLPVMASAEPPRVVADIAPVHSLVAMVMEGVGEPVLLLPPGASPHDHAMRPSEARALGGADAVVWMGDALAPWLGRAVGGLAPDARSVVLPDAEGTVLLPAREDPLLGEDHDHGHDHGEVDPHAWLDPRNAEVWLGAVADALAALDPENGEAYRANADAARARIGSLEEEIVAQLEPFRGTRYVVLHDAFQYFENRFDVPATAAIAIGDAADPGPARLRAIRDSLAADGVECAFAEPQLDPGLLAVVAEGTQTGVLDPLGTEAELGPELYPALLRGLADALTGCG